MTPKFYYKALISVTEDGVGVYMQTWRQLRETPHYSFCREVHNGRIMTSGKEKKIHKTSSKFAAETPNQAIKKLAIVKGFQNQHITRQLAMNNALIDGIEKLEKTHGTDNYVIPGTRDLVLEHYCFD